MARAHGVALLQTAVARFESRRRQVDDEQRQTLDELGLTGATGVYGLSLESNSLGLFILIQQDQGFSQRKMGRSRAEREDPLAVALRNAPRSRNWVNMSERSNLFERHFAERKRFPRSDGVETAPALFEGDDATSDSDADMYYMAAAVFKVE